MTRVRYNFHAGLIADNPLTIGALVINSADFAALPVVASPDYLVLVLDPLGNAPEIVWVTDHTSAASVVTVTRAQEGTAAAEHALAVPWIHPPTVKDFDDIEQSVVNDVAALATHLVSSDHDGRYYTEAEADALLVDKSATTHDHDADYEALGHTHGYSDPAHTHDDLYYTEAEVDATVSDLAALVHTHDDSYYTETEIDAFGYAPLASPTFTGNVQVPAGGVGNPGLEIGGATDGVAVSGGYMRLVIGGADLLTLSASDMNITIASLPAIGVASVGVRDPIGIVNATNQIGRLV